MTIDDIKAMMTSISSSDKSLIRKIVNILDDLREMDAEAIQRMLAMARMAKSMMPKELMGGVESMESDFTLVLAFIEQAKLYDRSDDAYKSAESIFGEEVKHE